MPSPISLTEPAWLREFKTFILRGNVIDLAVGIVIGAAFTGIVSSLVEDVINPIIGLVVGGIDFSNIFVVLAGERRPSLDATREGGAAVLAIGNFINAVIDEKSFDKLAKYIAAYNRLRNAVYVTYPYARTAGFTLNDVNFRLASITNKGDRKKYIKSREKELKAQFADPLSNLSVYQGRVLMKLINRQTGNNCYELIKEYRGGINARLYQTVAFFFGSSLKQDYDFEHDATDRQIESIVREIDGVWYDNPYKPGIKNY